MPKFLDSFNLDALNAEVEDVSNAVFAAFAYKDNPNEHRTAQLLQTMTDSITSAPLSISSISNIQGGWVGLESLSNTVFSTSIMLRKQRWSLMLMNYTAWYWLDVFVVDRAKAILDHQEVPDDGSWLENLVWDLDLHYQTRDPGTPDSTPPPTIINGRAYGINLPNTTYILEHRYNRIPSKEVRDQRVLSSVVSILEKWLKYPTDRSARQKAWFIHVMVMEFGPSVLYLDAVWKIYSDLHGRLFMDGDWRLDSFKVVKPIPSLTTLHPLRTDSTSPERCAIDNIANLIEGICDGKFTSNQACVMGTGTSTFLDTLPPPLRQLADKEMQLFESFVRANLDYQLNRTVASTLPHMERLASRLKSNPDKFLMFRELAPSRTRARSLEGPFTPRLVRTTMGIFSALVWRGITFGTEFAAVGDMVFRSADHFDSIRTALRKPEKYFCDQRAYGTLNPSRSTDLAHNYWDSLKGGVWENLVGTSGQIPFMDCWQFFLSGRKPPLFPQLGLLAAYLLTADLFYAGVVVEPTMEEMAVIIREMNKGAVAALERLRLIAPRPPLKRSKGKCDKEECRLAFKFITSRIKTLLPAELHSSLVVDWIMVEHTLCKFSRSLGKDLFQSSLQ